MDAVSKNLISPAYQAQLQDLHFSDQKWGTTGGKWLTPIVKFIHDQECDSVLDYGCGKGFLMEGLRRSLPVSFPIEGYDPGIDMLSALPRPADLVTCTDVLEHIEPEYLDGVIAHIAEVARKAAFFVISTRRAKAILPDGRNAHLIIQGREFWQERIAPHFDQIGVTVDEGRCELIVKAWK